MKVMETQWKGGNEKERKKLRMAGNGDRMKGKKWERKKGKMKKWKKWRKEEWNEGNSVKKEVEIKK